MSWYPPAIKSIKPADAGSFLGGPRKGVLHTTEGPSASGAISTFRANDTWPHFLVNYQGTVWQFIDTDRSSKALKNKSGGVETNRDGVVQIEIVGYASKPNNHPPAQMDALRILMRWIEANAGVRPKGPGKPFAANYGQNVRFTYSQWDSFDGWCGHCHVPENDHWDPGLINLTGLLPPPTPTPVPDTEVPVPFTITRDDGGYYVVGTDGGIFAYDGAPFYGSLPGVGVTAKAIGAALTPSELGYWLLGADGAVFGFGDAQYHGGWNTLPPEVKGNRVPVGIVASGHGYKIIARDPSGDSSPFDAYGFGL